MQTTFSEIFQQFLTGLLTGVLGILSAFLIALAKKGFDWLTAKINTIQDQNSRDKLNLALSILQDTTQKVVISLQQTLGDDIKQSLLQQDGRYTKEDLYELKEQAYNSIINYLNEDLYDILSDAYDDVESLIYDLIETQVRNLKYQEGTLLSSCIKNIESEKTTLLEG